MSTVDRVTASVRDENGDVSTSRIAGVITLVGAILFVLIPLYWMIATSLKSADVIGTFPPHLVPPAPTLEPYIQAFNTGPWVRWFTNTVVVSAGTTIMALALATPAAYALARRDFPGAKPLYVMFIGILMIPGQILLIPLYVVFAKLGLVDSHLGLIIAYSTFFLGFSVFLLHSFMTNLPGNLEDAARIGGVPEWKIFLKVILPLAKSGIAATGVLIFVFTWNEFLFALTFLQSEQLYTISVGLQQFQGLHGQVVYNQLFAMSTVATIPVILLFAIFSEQFIQGIAGLEMK